MLKYRILTALILIPLFVTLVLILSPPAFCIVTGLCILWGAFEWSSLMGIKKLPTACIYPILMFFILVGALELPIIPVLCIALVWWLLALLFVLLYPTASSWWKSSIFLQSIMGIFVLVPCWLAVNFLRNATNGSYTLLFLFVLIWSADSSAYFIGKKWGKHKLAPQVSPGKTWQGLMGALLFTVIFVLGVLAATQTPPMLWVPALLLTITTVLFSILGDLFESMLKRNAGLKDSGHLLPGHGGMLDRIDSLTAAAPVFAAGAILLGKYFH